jgi:hypothetical protein
MARKPYRTIRFHWKDGNGEPQSVEVFAPALLNNRAMVDRRLRKAELTELGEIVKSDEQEDWLDQGQVEDAFVAMNQFFDEHPESIPFSDILCDEIPPILDAVRKIPTTSRVRCCAVEP